MNDVNTSGRIGNSSSAALAYLVGLTFDGLLNLLHHTTMTRKSLAQQWRKANLMNCSRKIHIKLSEAHTRAWFTNCTYWLRYSERCLRRLSSSKQYISNVYGYIDLSAFSLICRALHEAGLRIGEEALESAVEKAYDDDSHEWLPAMKCLVDHILADYLRAKRKALRQEDSELTAANYFKSTKHLGLLLQKPIPRQVKHMAQIIKRSA